jgi:hypothetical protein
MWQIILLNKYGYKILSHLKCIQKWWKRALLLYVLYFKYSVEKLWILYLLTIISICARFAVKICLLKKSIFIFHLIFINDIINICTNEKSILSLNRMNKIILIQFWVGSYQCLQRILSYTSFEIFNQIVSNK